MVQSMCFNESTIKLYNFVPIVMYQEGVFVPIVMYQEGVFVPIFMYQEGVFVVWHDTYVL